MTMMTLRLEHLITDPIHIRICMDESPGLAMCLITVLTIIPEVGIVQVTDPEATHTIMEQMVITDGLIDQIAVRSPIMGRIICRVVIPDRMTKADMIISINGGFQRGVRAETK